jgi:hypothetical protein
MVNHIVTRMVKMVSGRWSYAEVMGLSSQMEEDCFAVYKEPIAKVPRWLKEALAELEMARKNGKMPVSQAQAAIGGVREKAPTKYLSQVSYARNSMMLGKCNEIQGKAMREVGGTSGESRKATAFKPQALDSEGVECSLDQGLPKGLVRAVSLEGVSAFNSMLELRSIREWLCRLRGEVDAGMERLDVVINHLKFSGSRQWSRVAGRIPKPTKSFKLKKKIWAYKKSRLGAGSSSSPRRDTGGLALERPMVIEKPSGVARLAFEKPKALGKWGQRLHPTRVHWW